MGLDLFAGARSGGGRSSPMRASSPSEGRRHDVFRGAKKRDKTGFRLDEGTVEQGAKNVGGAVRILKLIGLL